MVEVLQMVVSDVRRLQPPHAVIVVRTHLKLSHSTPMLA